MEFEQRIMITAEMVRQSECAGDGMVEHTAEARTIDRAGLHGEAEDSACELIHHDHHPVGFEDQSRHPNRGFRRFISTMAEISAAPGPFGPGLRRCFGVKSKRYFRFTKARLNAMRVEGLSTMAARSSRVGRIRPAQRLAMMRSIGRRFGALARDRIRTNS